MESARCPQPRVPSPIHSGASKGEEMLLLDAKETTNVKENVDGSKPRDALQQQVQPQISGEGKITKVEDVSEVTHDTVKEPASHNNALPVEEEVQQKMAAFEAGKLHGWLVNSNVKFVPCQWNCHLEEYTCSSTCCVSYLVSHIRHKMFLQLQTRNG